MTTFVTIGRAPLNQILIDHPTSINAARRAYESRRLLLAKGFEFNDKIRFGSVKAVFAGCSRKRWSPCAFREFCTSSTTRPESEAAAGGDAEGKMQFNDSSKEKLGQIENDAMKRGMTHEAAIPRRDGAAQGYRRIIAGPLT